MSEHEDKLRLRAIEVLDVLEIDTRDTNISQMMVYIEAFGKFVERNAVYGDLWREYGADDNLMHIRSKWARAERALKLEDSREEELVDSPLDLINYSAFFIRNVRGT